MKQLPRFHPFRSERAREEYLALYEERSKTWPVAAETRMIESPAGETFVRTSGDPDKPPLVLLPGSRGTSLAWIPNIAAWSAHHRTFALDAIYDFGLSVRRKKLTRPDDLASWLDEVLEALVPQGNINLLGLSYGGWLACLYALRFPQRVRKLVLLSPALTVLPAQPMLLLRALLTLIPLPGCRQQFYDWLLRDMAQSGAAGQAMVDEAVADWAVAERCFKPLPLIGATVLTDAELHDFKVPCLYLVGENEKIYSADRAVNRLKQVAPHILAEVIPHAGHDLWCVQAEGVNRRVLDFLR